MPKYEVTLEENVTYVATIEAADWEASMKAAEELWPELEASQYAEHGIEGPYHGGVEAVGSERVAEVDDVAGGGMSDESRAVLADLRDCLGRDASCYLRGKEEETLIKALNEALTVPGQT